jgi:3-oxoacyl-[acyl-carrier-protein] synthase II
VTERPAIAVTGLGAVSGFGWGADRLWAGLRAGRAAMRDFDRFDHTAHRTHLAAQVPPAPANGHRRAALADLFALAAAAEALDQAGLPPDLSPLGAGVFFGSSTGGMLESESYFEELSVTRRGGARIGRLRSQPANAPGDAVARRHRVTGPVQTISSACASATLAMASALDALRSGRVEIALAGGSDSLCRLTFAGFNSLRSVDPGPCRPFRRGREGLSLGEGAAVIVLETLAGALARGARPLALLAGAGASCDAHHMTAPDPSGAGVARAVRAALADAGLAADDIAFVNAHGTGTPLNDAAEWRALAAVFGGRAARLPVTSTKGNVGHFLGSAGAVEAVATVLGLERREVHPTPGEGPIDGECPVNLVLGAPRPLTDAARAALSVNFAFGGANAALVFTRPDRPAGA